MGWLFSALGAALALAGAASIIAGIPYIRLEFGWTQVIAGTTALSAGVVTMALGAVLFALQGIRRGLVAAGADIGPAMAVRTVLPFSTEEPAVEAPLVPPSDAEIEPSAKPEAAQPRLERFKDKLRTVGLPKERPTPDGDDRRSLEPVLAVPSSLSEKTKSTAHGEPDPVAGIRPSLDPPSSWRTGRLGGIGRDVDVEPLRVEPSDTTPAVAVQAETARETVAQPSEAPTVVGRYESGGASYVLFSDGTIEVETETGTHRFGSMQELRDHIGQQSSA